jgi:hypothetical protein
MADPIVQLSNAMSTTLNDLLSNNFISSSVLLGLSFYAYKAAPVLPSFMEELFLNVFFQIFVGFMVLYMGTGNFMLSLVVSVVFVYGMKMFSGLKEGMFGGNQRLDINSSIGKLKNTTGTNKLEDLQKKQENLKNFHDKLNNHNNQITKKSESMIPEHKNFITDLKNKIC